MIFLEFFYKQITINKACNMKPHIWGMCRKTLLLISFSLSYQKQDWEPANPSFGMTTTKILKDAFLQHVTHISAFYSRTADKPQGSGHMWGASIWYFRVPNIYFTGRSSIIIRHHERGSSDIQHWPIFSNRHWHSNQN